MSKLNGQWQDEASATWVIKSEFLFLEVYSPGGRGTFIGHELDLSNTVIYVNFSDIKPETGVLSTDGSTIYWGNGTKWVRISK